MKKFLKTLVLLSVSLGCTWSFAQNQVGVTLDLLSTPHPLALGVQGQHKNLQGFFRFGSFRSLENQNQPIIMRSKAVGVNYLLRSWYLGLEAGSQDLSVFEGTAKSKNLYLLPKVGYQFNPTKHFFIQTEIGPQFNFNTDSSGDMLEQKALHRFNENTTLNFTILRLGLKF